MIVEWLDERIILEKISALIRSFDDVPKLIKKIDQPYCRIGKILLQILPYCVHDYTLSFYC